MRILFVLSELSLGGAERTTQYLVNSFCKKHDVALLLYYSDRSYPINAKVDICCANLKHIDVGKSVRSWLIRIANRIKLITLPSRFVYEWKPDVVVSLIAESANWIMRVCKQRKIKIIVSERSNPQSVSYKKMLLRKKIMNQADGIIFQTNVAKEFYDQCIQDKGIVIHNAVGNELAYSLQPWLIDKAQKQIIAVGRLTWEKDYLSLIDAFEIVAKKHSDFNLKIIGTGAEKERIENYIKKKELEEKVTIIPPSVNALLEVRESRCYVLSSVSEGMPNALMEAMAVGIPCVSTRCPNGPEELIVDGYNGLLTAISNSKQLADAIDRVISDDRLSVELGQNARTILETNNIESVAEKYLNFIIEKVEGEM